MPSSHLILGRPLLLMPPVPPSIRVFSIESALRLRWPKYWSFSFSIIPSKEIPGADLLQNGLVGSPCSPRDCQESSAHFSSVTQSCLTLCDPMNHSTPGLPVHHHLSEFTQTHVHRVRDAIQPSHPRSSLSPPAPNPSQHQSLLQ